MGDVGVGVDADAETASSESSGWCAETTQLFGDGLEVPHIQRQIRGPDMYQRWIKLVACYMRMPLAGARARASW